MVKARTRTKLRRRQAFKTPNKIELIVCEGSSTEPTYFKALRSKLRLSAVRIEVISPSESEPIKIVEQAIAKKKEYDKVWCVVDVEIPPHRTLDEAWEKATETGGLELILTNPCIEYWFLLHFKKHTAPLDNNPDAMNKLKEVHPSYRKSRIGFDILYPRTSSAIDHSKEVLREKGCGDDLRNYNPSTHIHNIVEHLQNITAR
jgi:hypothetical protein